MDMNGLMSSAAPPPQQNQPPGPGQGQQRGAMPGGLQQVQQQPRPSLEQTMAGIHYFDSLMREFKAIANDPGLGKMNMRSRVFDALANMMGDRVLTVPHAMEMVKKLPTDPQQQKVAIQSLMKNAMLAKEKIIDDFRAQGAIEGDPTEVMAQSQWSPDSHMDHFQSLAAHYGGK